MIVNLIFIVLGVYLVLMGADKLTDGAVSIAERIGMPQIVIGSTIVAMGTSMPEFCVSFVSALKGTSDMAVGNVIGSNIFNSLLIVGCAAAIAPITILPATVKRDIPFALGASLMVLLICIDKILTRLDAFFLFLVFVYFMITTLKNAKGGDVESEKKEGKEISTSRAIFLMLFGLACLIVGSNVFVEHATNIARSLKVSDAVIGLTIVAGGTSLPELATSAVAARKGNSGIAIGNVLGSNVFNILFVLSITGMINPMHISGITAVDLTVLLLSMVLLWLFSFTKSKIERWEGWVLLVVFVAYMVYLINTAV